MKFFYELYKIKYDFKVYSNNLSIYHVPVIILFSHTFHLVVCYRVGKALASIKFIGIFFRYFFEYFIRIFFSSDISLKSTIGRGLKFEHGHDIVIGADVIIGDNCKILNGVTLGGKDPFLPSSGNQPTIGNNVILSTGSKILGPIVIGNYVIVGANSVVLSNIKANVTVVGIPAKVLNK